MNFSIFDDTLGSIDRITTIQGNGTDNTLTGGDAYWFKQQIAEAMNENGIGVANVNTSKSGNNVLFEIEVINSTNVSAEAIRQMVATSLANKWYSYNAPLPGGIGGLPQQRRIFSNVSARVLSDTGPAQTGSSGGGGQTTAGSGQTYFPYPTPSAPGTQIGSNSGTGFLDSLGLGLGVSTPIVVGAGALLLLLILKK